MKITRAMTRLVHIVSIVLLLPSYAAVAEEPPPAPIKIVVPPMEKAAEAQGIYFYKLLHLVMSKTETSDGPFEISTYPEPLSTERYLVELKNGGVVNVMWTTMNTKREQEVLPIRISLLKDLNSYRLLLIRKENQPNFDKVNSVDDLRKFTAGLGSQWPDTEIMRSNDLNVITSLTYDSLFRMLAAKRFDYFPRGLYEIWNEVELYKNKNITIENHLMLYYDSPFYFMVSKQNTALADRIERGLKIAIADGSFDQLMMSVPSFKRGMEEQEKSHRRLIKLHASF